MHGQRNGNGPLATVFPDSRGRLRLDSVMLQRVHLSDTRFCIGGLVAAEGAFREKRIRQCILLLFADGNEEQGKCCFAFDAFKTRPLKSGAAHFHSPTPPRWARDCQGPAERNPSPPFIVGSFLGWRRFGLG
jgi:hypothetical protein